MFSVKTILHRTDFSEQPDATFQLVCGLPQNYEARLIVIYVKPARKIVERQFGMVPFESKEEEETLKNRLFGIESPDRRVAVGHYLLRGNAGEEINRVARETDCDLIVMGTHGRSAVDRILMGSVAEQVVRRAPCLVATVKQPLRLRATERATQAMKEAPHPTLAAL